MRIQDGKKSDPGFGKNIPDPQHCRYLNEIIVFYADLHPQLPSLFEIGKKVFKKEKK